MLLVKHQARLHTGSEALHKSSKTISVFLNLVGFQTRTGRWDLLVSSHFIRFHDRLSIEGDRLSSEPVLALPAVTKDSFQATKKHQFLLSGDKTLMRTCALDAKHPLYKIIINYVGNKTRMDQHLLLRRDSTACE